MTWQDGGGVGPILTLAGSAIFILVMLVVIVKERMNAEPVVEVDRPPTAPLAKQLIVAGGVFAVCIIILIAYGAANASEVASRPAAAGIGFALAKLFDPLVLLGIFGAVAAALLIVRKEV